MNCDKLPAKSLNYRICAVTYTIQVLLAYTDSVDAVSGNPKESPFLKLLLFKLKKKRLLVKATNGKVQ